MSSQLTIEGVEYISSKRASEITGYSQDYVGQLARAGKILGKRVGGLWYVVADSLSGYKELADTYTPTPPLTTESKALEDTSFVTFEGKTYMSAARASKLTSYHQDYIGQLARGGKVLSRQVGKRWYVDVDALKEHKKEKDALLGAVQVSSVGLDKKESGKSEAKEVKDEASSLDVGLHYTYKPETLPLIPIIEERDSIEKDSGELLGTTEPHNIPIRIVHSRSRNIQQISEADYRESRREKKRETSVLSIFIKTFPIIAVVAVSLIAFNFSPSSISLTTVKMPKMEVNGTMGISSIGGFMSLMNTLLTKKIQYSRE